MMMCSVCQNKDWQQVYKIDDWDILECSLCGFSRISPFPERDSRPGFYLDRFATNKHRAKKRSFVRKWAADIKTAYKRVSKRDKNLIFYTKLQRYVKPGAKLLDIACADGIFIESAKKKYACTGIDISEELIKLAKQKYPDCEFIAGNYLEEHFTGKKYDAITIISLLEHLDDPQGALQKSYDLLNPGGVLLLKTVNYGSLNRKFMKEKWTGFRPPDHMVYFTPRNLKQLLENTGFSKTKTSAPALNDNMYCDAWK